MTLPEQNVAKFYEFITERENIRLRRLLSWPREQWTLDPIFQTYSFTNVKREHDRTTTLLKREFYDPFVKNCDSMSITDELSMSDAQQILLNAALFRFTGTIEAARVMGWTDEWTTENRKKIFNYGLQDDIRFTSAYIIPACGQSRPKYEIILEIVDQIWGLRSENGSLKSGWQAEKIVLLMNNTGWQCAVEEMTQLWGVGSFMAKEVLLDYILAINEKPKDWQTWTPVGPGGARGAARVKYGVKIKISERDALDVILELYEASRELWREDFVELDLTDVQFQLCEFDKYSRVAEGRKPKRRFRPTIDDVTRRR